MNLHDWLLAVLPIENWRIKKVVSKSLEEFNANGILNSHSVFLTSIHTGFDELDSLTESLINKLSQKRISVKEWNKTKKFILKYIDSFYEDILKFVVKASGYEIEKMGTETLNEIVLPRKNESEAVLDLCIDKQIDSVKSRRWVFIWDVIKIIASALVGAAFALLVQK